MHLPYILLAAVFLGVAHAAVISVDPDNLVVPVVEELEQEQLAEDSGNELARRKRCQLLLKTAALIGQGLRGVKDAASELLRPLVEKPERYEEDRRYGGNGGYGGYRGNGGYGGYGGNGGYGGYGGNGGYGGYGGNGGYPHGGNVGYPHGGIGGYGGYGGYGGNTYHPSGRSSGPPYYSADYESSW